MPEPGRVEVVNWKTQMRVAANVDVGYAAVIIARRQAGRRPVVVGAGVLDGGLARLPGEARVKAAVVGSTAAAVAPRRCQPTGRWTATLGLCRLVVRSRRHAGSPRRAVGRGFVVARLGWRFGDANQPRFRSSFGPVGARMGESLYHLVGKHLQTVTRAAWRGTFGIWKRIRARINRTPLYLRRVCRDGRDSSTNVCGC
jgi:hypothetical protein